MIPNYRDPILRIGNLTSAISAVCEACKLNDGLLLVADGSAEQAALRDGVRPERIFTVSRLRREEARGLKGKWYVLEADYVLRFLLAENGLDPQVQDVTWSSKIDFISKDWVEVLGLIRNDQ
jgi:hypothetical protein